MNFSNLFVAACALDSSAVVLGFQMSSSSCNSPTPFLLQTKFSGSTISLKKSRKQGSLLRVATVIDHSECKSANKQNNQAVIRQIDQNIQINDNEQYRHEYQPGQANAEPERIQRTKRRHLEGTVVREHQRDAARFSETAARSLVKAALWRVIAGGVTFFTSLRFSGSLLTALSIVGSDFFSKAATMFVGERLLNRSQAGRGDGADAVGRSLAKALLWRVFAIANTMTTGYLIAKNLSMVSKIAGSDAVLKTGLMFAYERLWAKIDWGKEYVIARDGFPA